MDRTWNKETKQGCGGGSLKAPTQNSMFTRVHLTHHIYTFIEHTSCLKFVWMDPNEPIFVACIKDSALCAYLSNEVALMAKKKATKKISPKKCKDKKEKFHNAPQM